MRRLARATNRPPSRHSRARAARIKPGGGPTVESSDAWPNLIATLRPAPGAEIVGPHPGGGRRAELLPITLASPLRTQSRGSRSSTRLFSPRDGRRLESEAPNGRRISCGRPTATRSLDAPTPSLPTACMATVSFMRVLGARSLTGLHTTRYLACLRPRPRDAEGWRAHKMSPLSPPARQTYADCDGGRADN
jgi:hypothetical protein